MELELLKPELAFQEEKITSTVVVFGSTRLVEPALAAQRLQEAEAHLAAAPNDPRRRRTVEKARRLNAHSCYYEIAREFAGLVRGLRSRNRISTT